jgi:peptide/nickel transport system substrate-binding protein
LIFNNRLDGPLADRGVRTAISLAVNRDDIASIAYKGFVQPNTSLLYPGALPQPISTIPNGGQQDVDAARQQLAQTAYSSGFGFKLQVWGSRPGGVDACLVLQQQLKALNITVDIDNVEDATGLARLGNHDFEVYYQAPTAYPPVAFYGNALQQGNSWTTWSGYNNPDADSLIASAATEPDPDKRLAIFMRLETMNAADLTYIPLHSRVDVHATRVGPAFGYANYSQYPTALTLADLPA